MEIGDKVKTIYGNIETVSSHETFFSLFRMNDSGRVLARFYFINFSERPSQGFAEDRIVEGKARSAVAYE